MHTRSYTFSNCQASSLRRTENPIGTFVCRTLEIWVVSIWWREVLCSSCDSFMIVSLASTDCPRGIFRSLSSILTIICAWTRSLISTWLLERWSKFRMKSLANSFISNELFNRISSRSRSKKLCFGGKRSLFGTTETEFGSRFLDARRILLVSKRTWNKFGLFLVN